MTETARLVHTENLYSYFPDKSLLLIQWLGPSAFDKWIMRSIKWFFSIPKGHDIGCWALFPEVLTLKFGQQIFRICLTESDRIPDIGRACCLV